MQLRTEDRLVFRRQRKCHLGHHSHQATTAAASSTRVSTYITDNLTTDYAQVWVGIKTISAVDSSGAEVTLSTSADSSGYSTYDLRSLASVGELMSAASIPAAVYQQIKVTLAPDVKLVKASDNSVINATFTSDGSDKVVRVSVTFDASTNLVTADVSRKDGGALKDFKFHQGEVRGTVVSVDTTANTITVNDARLGSATVLALASDAVITKESDGTTGSYTATLVEVAGAAATSKSSSATRPSKVEGTITAISSSAWTVSMPNSAYGVTAGTYTVNVSAAYIKGSTICQAVGSTIEARGTLSGTTLTARNVKVKSCVATSTS